MNMNNQPLKLVATDLDGTFLKNDKSISQDNLEILCSLGEKGILRVVATGRNLKKTLEVISEDVPFDYIVFSSGAGVYDCMHKKLIYHQNLNQQIVQQLADFLVGLDMNFHLFKPVPENYNCWFHRGSTASSEFERYFDFQSAHAEPMPLDRKLGSEACQFLIVFPDHLTNFMAFKNDIEHHFPEVKVVRTSSPLDTGFIWMEIFHQSVSKGNGVKYVCDALQIDHAHTLGIGNDYNDLDLLEFTNYSYLVENGPQELKERFLYAASNEESAFAKAIKKYID